MVEEVIGGKLQRRDGAVREFTSDQLINVPVSFMVAPSESFAALGQSIRTLFEGQLQYNPIIVHGTEAELGQISIVFGSQEDSLFDLFGEATPTGTTLPGEGELVALWYAVEVNSPESEPITVERTWFDRLGAEARLQPEPDLTRIAPLETYTSADGSTMVRGLERITMLSVDVARLPSTIALGNQQLNDTFAYSNAMGPAYATLRDGLGLLIERDLGYAATIASPQVIAFTFVPPEADSGSTAILVSADLLVHAPTVVTFGDDPGRTLHPAVSAGIADQVAEQMVLDPVSWSVDPVAEQVGAVAPVSIHIGSVFATARAQGIPISVLSSVDQVDAPATTKAAIQAALDLGLVVVSPEQTVEMDGAQRFGWWEIDPVTGVTQDRMDTGGGSVATRVPGRIGIFFSPLTEYLVAIRYWWSVVDGIKCFAAVLAASTAFGALQFISNPDAQAYAAGAWYVNTPYAVGFACALI